MLATDQAQTFRGACADAWKNYHKGMLTSARGNFLHFKSRADADKDRHRATPSNIAIDRNRNVKIQGYRPI